MAKTMRLRKQTGTHTSSGTKGRFNRILAALAAVYLLGGATLSQAALMFNDCPGLTLTAEVEGNDTIGTAQNIDGLFNTESCRDIELGVDSNGDPFDQSDMVPHVSIENDIAHDQRDLDFFEFEVTEAGVTGIFDIDFGEFDDPSNNFDDGFNSWIEIYDDTGARLGFNNNSSIDNPQGDTESNTLNSFLEYTFSDTGLFYVAVGKSCNLADFLAGFCSAISNSISPMDVEKSYVLHVSLLAPAQVPAPGTLLLFAAGAVGAGVARRRRQPVSGAA